MVVGLDLSLTGTGLAIGDRLVTIKSEPNGKTLTDRRARLMRIVAAIEDNLADPIPAPPRLVVIEAPAFSRTTGHHHDRSGLWWLVVEGFYAAGVPVVEVTPTALKRFATGKGVASKSDMRMALFKRAGLDVADDNQVDAAWLRQIGLHLTGQQAALPLPQTHLAALTKINWKE